MTTSGTGDNLLELSEVAVRFGTVRAVDGVSFGIRAGSIHGLIGPNGSGKTTLMNAISGFQSLFAGDIRYNGKSIRRLRSHRRARIGIRRSFQHPVTFPDLSTLENTLVGMHTIDKLTWARACIPVMYQRLERQGETAAVGMLREIDLSGDTASLVKNLSYGQQRLTDLARASAAGSGLILLDEPGAGLSHDQLAHLIGYVKTLRDAGSTVLVTDHNMGFMSGLCDRISVMDFGQLIAEGTPSEIRGDPRVLEAYLGAEAEETAKRPQVVGTESLVLDGITAGYAGSAAIADVSLAVARNETVALVGANGAGKTTTLRTISGLLRPRAGSLTWSGQSLSGLAPAKIVAGGIAHVPEGRGVLGGMTVQDNLLLGAYVFNDRARVRSSLDRVNKLFPILNERSKQLAGSLSGGEQQMLAIGRALMSEPRILMLDEPSQGLAPKIVDQIFALIEELRESGLGILLVEQNVARALTIADRGYVLSHGRVVVSGAADELANSESIKRAYLGA